MRDVKELIQEYTPFLQGDRRLYSEEDVERMLRYRTIEVLEDVGKTILQPPKPIESWCGEIAIAPRDENGCLTKEAVKALKDYTVKERFDRLLQPINLNNPAQEILDKNKDWVYKNSLMSSTSLEDWTKP